MVCTIILTCIIFFLNPKTGITLVVSVLKSDILVQKLTDTISSMFEIGSRIITVNAFKNGKKISICTGQSIQYHFQYFTGMQ